MIIYSYKYKKVLVCLNFKQGFLKKKYNKKYDFKIFKLYQKNKKGKVNNFRMVS